MKIERMGGAKAFTKDVFEIVEWTLVVAAIQVAGDKLHLPVAIGIGMALQAILSFYVGMRVEELVAWARKGVRPDAWHGILLVLFAAGAIGAAISALIKALSKVSLGT